MKNISIRKESPNKCSICGEDYTHLISYNDPNNMKKGRIISKKGEMPVQRLLHPTHQEYSCDKHIFDVVVIILQRENL